VTSGNGFTVKDVLDTDWRDMMEVFGADIEQEKESEKVQSLEDFIRAMH